MFGKMDNFLRTRERIRYSEMSCKAQDGFEEKFVKLDEGDEGERSCSSGDEDQQGQQQGSGLDLSLPEKDVDQGTNGSHPSSGVQIEC